MRLTTLALFLVGNRQAILGLAADRRALWVGLLFVLSAGLAREYDGADLMREPWHLVIPLAVSLAASFLLFLVACGRVFLTRGERPPFWSSYRAFLTLFWMTAPLAWLYAIPYERFLSPGSATNANFLTLALVAAWRVALMVKVVTVLTDRRWYLSFWLVMAFGNAVLLGVIYFLPRPVIAIMGGVRLSESEAAVNEATILVTCLGVLAAPVFGIGGLVAFFTGKPQWVVPTAPQDTVSPGRGPWILAALSLLIWLPILPRTQSEQQLRSRAEDVFASGNVRQALELMSAHAEDDFPPHWEPPPKVGGVEPSSTILDTMDLIAAHDHAQWVRSIYLEKFERYLGGPTSFHAIQYRGAELARIVSILRQLPEGPALAAQFRNLDDYLKAQGHPDADRNNFKALADLAEKARTQQKAKPKKDAP